MIKKLLYTFIFLATATAFAQIPAGYYDSATGTGYTLKTQLFQIINTSDDGLSTEYFHTDQGYNAMDGFITQYDIDNYYENDNTILDPYSENPNGTDPYTFTPSTDECGNYSSEGDCYNKEHVIPQSVFSQGLPMRSDAHHLLPTDGRVNGFRSNYPFGVVNDNQLISQNGISNPTMNGSKLGANLNSGYSAGYSGTVFEPIDEFKGDIARIYFYFITRYEDQIDQWGSYAMFNGTTDQVLDDTFLSILLTWHQNDPVSQKEIDRNNNIFNYQGNRNPFIDHPEYINAIWSNTPQDNIAPTTPTNVIASNPTATTIDVSWTASTDNVGVSYYDIYADAAYMGTSNTTSYTAQALSPETTYCFTVIAYDAAGNNSTESSSDCETTLENANGTLTDLFFSEYIEGSGNNKALEIANFTGNDINLGNYSIQLAMNGASTWSTTNNNLPNVTLANGDVYVVANSGLSVCTTVVDYTYNAATQFNGNDAVGLFNNGVLVDVIGTLGSSADFAANITLVRNANAAVPSTIYDANDWTSYSQNTCDNLGSHSITLTTDNFDVQNTFTIYPNPVNHNSTIHFSKEMSGTLYDNLGRQILVFNATTEVVLQNISSGIYIFKFNNGNSNKIIVQ